MPRSFFDQVLVPSPKRRSPWVTASSVLLHTLGIALLLVWPLMAAFEIPAIHTPLPPMMIATAAPPPPDIAPPPPAAVAQLNADAAPVEAPDSITEEIPRPSVSNAPPVPGSIGLSTGPRVPGVLGDRTFGGPGLTPPPPPVRQPEVPRRVGSGIQTPTRTAYKPPVYPPIAVTARIEGTVILEAIIDAQGAVQDLKVLRSVPMLDRAAIEAVQHWRYTPTRLNGQAIPIIMTVTVTFSLR